MIKYGPKNHQELYSVFLRTDKFLTVALSHIKYLDTIWSRNV